jgi:DNA-binding NarL/FixJ family response regulator
VITDLNMPVMDGYVVIRTIHEEAPQTKIVVVAAADRDKVEARLTEIGVAAMLAKPITQSQLIDTVHSVLGTNATSPI